MVDLGWRSSAKLHHMCRQALWAAYLGHFGIALYSYGLQEIPYEEQREETWR